MSVLLFLRELFTLVAVLTTLSVWTLLGHAFGL